MWIHKQGYNKESNGSRHLTASCLQCQSGAAVGGSAGLDHGDEILLSAAMKFFSRRKRKNRFIELLMKQAEHARDGLQTLLEYVKEPDEALARQLTQTEKEADEVRRILIDELNRTFVTPIDREDIFALSLTVDDVLDYANTTIEELEMLEIAPTPFMVRMVSLLNDATREIYLAVERLEDHPNVANDHAVRAKALENRVETVYREAIADLFHLPRDIDHVVDMLKLREVYRHLSNAADRGDAAANVIGDIVVKRM